MTTLPKRVRNRTEYQREYYNEHEYVQMRNMLRYYRNRMNKGKNYVPKEWSRLVIWCNTNSIDCTALIEGRIKAPWEL